MISAKSVEDELRCYGFQKVDQIVLEKVTNWIESINAGLEDVVSGLVAFSSNQGEEEPMLTNQLFTEFQKDYVPENSKPQMNNSNASTPPSRHDHSLKSDQDLNILSAYCDGPLTPVQTAKRVQSTPDNSARKKRSNIMGTSPAYTSPLPSRQTPGKFRDSTTPSKKYIRRTNKSEVVSSHGDCTQVNSWNGSREQVSVKVVKEPSAGDDAYRYMFQKLQDRACVLDRRIDDLADSIRQQAQLEELSSVCEKTTAEVYVAGMICCDCEGKLNTESVLLQGCMNVSGGRAVPVSTTDLSKYSLFPGQTVVLKAQNEDGVRLKAVECHMPEALPTTKIEEFEGLSLMVACGPFTPDNSNDYAPLNDLLTQAETSPPDVLILMGPFLDVDNQVLLHSVESYEQVFERQVDQITKRMTEVNPSMHLVFVASSRDLHHEPVYPTPPYACGLTSSQQVHFGMDPCTLDVGGVRIGLTATDILFQMAANEIYWDAPTKDRMLRLSEHMLRQRSYFPLYPPTADFNLDLELNESHGAMRSSPHLLVMSSNFNQFVKVGKKTVFANPGRLSKGEGGGTFMRMRINPISNDDHITDSFLTEIVRI